jgi:hypothetical protein
MIDHKDNQDDWSPPLTFSQIAVSYNPGKDNLPLVKIICLWVMLRFDSALGLSVVKLQKLLKIPHILLMENLKHDYILN